MLGIPHNVGCQFRLGLGFPTMLHLELSIMSDFRQDQANLEFPTMYDFMLS